MLIWPSSLKSPPHSPWSFDRLSILNTPTFSCLLLPSLTKGYCSFSRHCGLLPSCITGRLGLWGSLGVVCEQMDGFISFVVLSSPHLNPACMPVSHMTLMALTCLFVSLTLSLESKEFPRSWTSFCIQNYFSLAWAHSLQLSQAGCFRCLRLGPLPSQKTLFYFCFLKTPRLEYSGTTIA